MDTIKTAIWLSRILRWGLGIFFLAIAYMYDDAKILYFFGSIFIITGFLKPQRCIQGACYFSASRPPKDTKISFEEVK